MLQTVALLFLPIILFAQAPVTVPASCINSIGLITETNGILGGQDMGSVTTFGVQYTRKKEKKPAYFIGLGYATYTGSRPSAMQTIVTRDTAESRWAKDKIDMLMLSGGVELQKQFYHKLYFFGGIQARLGYGVGSRDTMQEKTYNGYQFDPATKKYYKTTEHYAGELGSVDNSMIYFGVTPYFGLKLAFKRFDIGTTFMNYVTFKALTAGGKSDGMVDFSINDLTQQFFVRYKF